MSSATFSDKHCKEKHNTYSEIFFFFVLFCVWLKFPAQDSSFKVLPVKTHAVCKDFLSELNSFHTRRDFLYLFFFSQVYTDLNIGTSDNRFSVNSLSSDQTVLFT